MGSFDRSGVGSFGKIPYRSSKYLIVQGLRGIGFVLYFPAA